MKTHKGFTLIELMMVVAIIGILSAVALPQYQNHVARTEVSASLQDLRSWMNAMKDYFARYGHAPSDDSAFRAYIGAALTDMQTASGSWTIVAGTASATVEFPASGVSAVLANKSYTISTSANPSSAKSINFEVSSSSDDVFTSGAMSEAVSSAISG